MKTLTRREMLKRAAAMGAGALFADNLVALARAQSGGEPITVRYLTPLWASTTDRRPERQIAFTRVIESFNDAYADQGIQVQEVVGDDNPITITQEMDAGNVDAAWINYGTYPNHLLAGQLIALEPHLSGEADAFFPWTTGALRSVNGTLAALWHNTDTPLLYYNTEKIPNPPATWSDVVAVAETIKAEEPNAFAITYPFVGWLQMNSGLYEALGGTWVDENGAPVLFDGTNRDIWVKMFTWYVDLLERGLIPPAAVANDQYQQMPDVYAGNVYSFAGNSNFHLRELQPNLPPEEYEKWSAVPLPYPDEAGSGRYQAGGWLIAPVATGDVAREAAAAAWTLHATGFRAQRDTCKAGGWIPTRPAVLREDPYYAEDPFAVTTLQALENGQVMPLVPILLAMANAVQTAITAVASAQATIEQALDDAKVEVDREYEALN